MDNSHVAYFVAALLMAAGYLLVLPRVSRTNPLVRGVLVLLSLFFMSRYLAWRILTVLGAAELSIDYCAAVSLLAIEVFLGYLFLRSSPANRMRTNRSPDVDEHLRWWRTDEPRVDVLIPTYNESADVLERTFVGARHLAYGNVHVHVLDDGRRDWVRDLALEFGFDYLARDSNVGYKAGNLNNGIADLRRRGIESDFLAVFDADFVARPEFLLRTLSLFGPEHREVGLVQTPQFFFNPDPFQYAFRSGAALPDEQRGWFDYALPVLDVRTSTTCCGTSFVVRGSALAQVGFFPGETLCEDAYVSFKLADAGYKTIYLDEILSVGLAPEGIKEFLSQRYRWCLGWIQISHLRCIAGKQRLRASDVWRFVCMVSKWPLPAMMKIIWTALPLLMMCFDSTIYQMTVGDFLGVRLPHLVAMYGVAWLSGFTGMPFLEDGQVLFQAPTLIRACWNFFTGKQNERFVVTDKGVSREGWTFHWRPARVPFFLAVLTFAVLVGEVIFSPSVSGDAGRMGFMMWALLNCASLYVALVTCFEPPQTRRAVRFRCSLEARLVFGDGAVLEGEAVDISERGMRVRCPRVPSIGEPATLSVAERTREVVVRARHRDGTLGLEFVQSSDERRELIRWILASPGFVPETRAWNGLAGARHILRHLFSPMVRGPTGTGGPSILRWIRRGLGEDAGRPAQDPAA